MSEIVSIFFGIDMLEAPRFKDVIDFINTDTIWTSALISPYSDAKTMGMLGAFHGRFDQVITAHDVDGRIPPSPRACFETAMRLNVPRNRGLLVSSDPRMIMAGIDGACRLWRVKHLKNLTIKNLEGMANSFAITI